jgi:hypothetical protein
VGRLAFRRAIKINAKTAAAAGIMASATKPSVAGLTRRAGLATASEDGCAPLVGLRGAAFKSGRLHDAAGDEQSWAGKLQPGP